MDLKELVKTAISETCTHWLISDDADLKKVSKKLTKELETIINAEIERRQPGSTKNNGLHKHVVSKSALLDEWNDGYNRGCEDTHAAYNDNIG